MLRITKQDLFSFGSVSIALCMIIRSTDVLFRSAVLPLTDTLTLVTWEHLIGLLGLSLAGLLPRLKRIRTLPWRGMIAVLLIGSFVSLGGILCFSAAFRHMNPAVVILLQKLQPVVSIFLALLLLGEKPKRSFYPLALAALIAGYVLTFGLTPPSTLWAGAAPEGVGLALLSVLFWGSGTVLGRYVLSLQTHEVDTTTLTICRYSIGALTGVAALLVTRSNHDLGAFVSLEPGAMLRIVYIALVPGLLAILLFYRGLRTTGATLASLLELIFPLSSALIVWVFLGKPLNPSQIVAACALWILVTLLSLKK